jgi:parallel beta-helix repeat protein
MSDSNYIDENTCNSNRRQWSIFLGECKNNYVRNNICQNNLWGIKLSGSHSNSIINNNLYFNDYYGLEISGSNSNIIKNNTCLNNGNGIFIHGSISNDIQDNICNFNNYSGICFGSSHHNIIEQNNFSNNKFGIYLDIVDFPYSQSSNNRFSNNIISKNTKVGISIDYRSKNNEVYLNNISSNTKQAIDNATNNWNTSSGFGNYWSDYAGLDNGADGRIAGDGIGDTELPHQGLDNFPLMEPYVENLTLENIRILLELDKFEFIVNEPITGSIQIINDNSFNITFLRTLYGWAEPLEYFAVNLIDNSKGGYARIDKDLSSIEISAYNTMKIEFTIVEYRLENRFIHNLNIGNYSIFAFFYYGNSYDYEWIVSNIVEFRIITNKSTLVDEENNGDLTSTSSGSMGLSQTQIFNSIAGLTIVIIIISTLFITSTEVGKFGFFSAIAPLYTKTRKKKKDHEYGYIKGSVRGYILGNPGESYNNIKRTLNLPNGTLAYYLRVLEREHIIRSERDGFRRRFYPAKGSSANDVFDLSDIQRKIKNIIQKLPGISQKEILSYLDISQQKLNYHIQLMVKARIIRLKREGKSTKCYIIDDVSKA